jgi:hypothetical protein
MGYCLGSIQEEAARREGYLNGTLLDISAKAKPRRRDPAER